MKIMKNRIILIVIIVLILTSSCKKQLNKENVYKWTKDEISEELKSFRFAETYFGKVKRVSIENDELKHSNEVLGIIDIVGVLNKFNDTKHLLLKNKFYVNFAKYDNWQRLILETCNQTCDLCFAACKIGLERKFKDISERFASKSFWIITLDIMNSSPTSIVLKEGKDRIFIDGINGEIFLLSEKGSYSYAEYSDYDLIMMRIDGGEITDEVRLFHYAIAGYKEKVKDLLEKGTSPNWTEFGRDCKFALDCAKKYCNIDIVELLKKYKAKETFPEDKMEYCFVDYWERKIK
jgi:hypothetical protein